ncbi:MAG: hypothetical protein ACFE9I_16395 [Candidatus Hermodarchaeota archaeon]
MVIISLIGFISLLIISIIGLNLSEPQFFSLDSGWKIEDVSIDGIFTNNSEWSDASKIQINEVSFLYFKNDNDCIYLCLDAIGDMTLDDGDFFRIHFDTNNDKVWSAGEEDSFAYYSGMFSGGTHYILNITGTPHEYVSHCSFICDSKLKGDTSYSVSPNSNQNHQIYEMQIPFSILGINETEQIGFFVYGGPFDANVPIYNTYPKNADPLDMNTWATLTIGDSEQTGKSYIQFSWDFLYIILLIISIVGICIACLIFIYLIFIKKKKGEINNPI